MLVNNSNIALIDKDVSSLFNKKKKFNYLINKYIYIEIFYIVKIGIREI